MKPLGTPTHELINKGRNGCVVCGSELASDRAFCRSHGRAERNLRSGYDAWNRAYESISLENYLVRLAKVSETGAEVKEIIRYFQANPDKWKGNPT